MLFFYAWITVMTLAVILEALFRRYFGLLLLPGSTAAMLMAAYGVRRLYQVAVFFGVSLLLLFGLFLVKKPRVEKKPLTMDAMIGEMATVIEPIESIAGSGEVEVLGTVWSARAIPEETVYLPGDILSVVAVEGVTLICKK